MRTATHSLNVLLTIRICFLFGIISLSTLKVAQAQIISGDVLRAGGNFGTGDDQDPFIQLRANDDVDTYDSWIWSRGNALSGELHFAHDSKMFLAVETDVLAGTLRLNQNGLGIRADPSATLHVGRGFTSDAQVMIENDYATTSERTLLKLYNNGAPKIEFKNTAGGTSIWSVGHLDSDGFSILNEDEKGFIMDSKGDVTFTDNVEINGEFEAASSMHIKQNFIPVDTREILALLNEVKISYWSYIKDEDQALHLGPFAEDIFDKFQLGKKKDKINVMDAIGISMAAIQGLHTEIESKSDEIEVLNKRIARLEAHIFKDEKGSKND